MCFFVYKCFIPINKLQLKQFSFESLIWILDDKLHYILNYIFINWFSLNKHKITYNVGDTLDIIFLTYLKYYSTFRKEYFLKKKRIKFLKVLKVKKFIRFQKKGYN